MTEARGRSHERNPVNRQVRNYHSRLLSRRAPESGLKKLRAIFPHQGTAAAALGSTAEVLRRQAPTPLTTRRRRPVAGPWG